MNTNNLFSLLLVTAMTGTTLQGCSGYRNDTVTNDPASNETEVSTRAVGVKTPKFTVYIETNDINPLNAGEYYFCNSSPREEVVDHVILFASNIRGNATSAWLHHNQNQTYILNNVSTLVQPLQSKGIKVLLGLLGDHTGVGFANLNAAMLESFAQQVATCVNTYGLDGVDLDDEYARYDLAPAGLPSPSAVILGNLVTRLRELMPNKLITAFSFGNYIPYMGATVFNSLDYMHPNYGCNPTPPSGLPNSKWAKLSVHIQSQSSTNPTCSTMGVCANNYTGYGEVMMFNLREWDASSKMNCFASRLWGRTVCWTGTSHYKNYP
jgi:hypothetical protein